MSDYQQLPQVGDFKLLPPEPGLCQTCGLSHEEEYPHDAQSLYFQYLFYADHGRWPTWRDALAHCSSEMQERWESALTERGVSLDGSVNP